MVPLWLVGAVRVERNLKWSGAEMSFEIWFVTDVAVLRNNGSGGGSRMVVSNFKYIKKDGDKFVKHTHGVISSIASHVLPYITDA